jgi:hypothetical protein
VIDLGLPWTPDAGAPLPLLFQTDRDTVVIYHPARSTGRAGDRVVLRFDGCLVSKFGYPDDEALPGHPLYERGLGLYRIFEVLNSSWLEEIRQQNLVSFPGATWWPGPSPVAEKLRSQFPDRPTPPDHPRHFVVTFHDETFECLADSVAGEFTSEPLEAIVSSLAAGPGRRSSLS